MFGRFLNRLAARSSPRKPRLYRSLPLRLEYLEDRTLLSTVLYPSANVPQSIPGNGTVTSSISISDNYIVGDVQVTLNLSDATPQNLDVFLQAPDNGPRIELFHEVAFPTSNGAAPFQPLTLSDEAVAPIGDAATNFAGKFQPEQSLSAFEGNNVQGTWKLEVSDNTVGDVGSIVDWSLTITNQTNEAEPNNTSAKAQVIDPSSVVKGAVAPAGDLDYYQINIPEAGRLQARVAPTVGSSLQPELALYAPDGSEVVQSDGVSASDATALIDQYLTPGVYQLRVSGQTVSGVETRGAYRLQTEFNASSLPSLAYGTGSIPVSQAVADLNGDGQLDVVTANAFSNNISVLMGNGDGTFQPEQLYNVGSHPLEVLVVDANGDGRPDIIVLNVNSNNVSVLLNNGDGTFQPAQNYEVGSSPKSLVAADLDGDGRIDLITANSGSNDLSILYGNGNGTFQNAQTLSVGVQPTQVAAKALTSDGLLDLVAVNADSDSVSVFLNGGNQTFLPRVDYTVGHVPAFVSVQDLNGDGYADIVTLNASTKDVSVLLNDGHGGFGTQQEYSLGFDAFADVTMPTIADVNNDGRPDILVPNAEGNNVSLLLNNGDGTFKAAQLLAVGKEPTAVATADVNKDGKIDVISVNGDGSVSVLLGNGDGTFLPQRTLQYGTGVTGSIAVADVNRDGQPDLLILDPSQGLVVLLGNGDGTFAPQFQNVPLGGEPTDLVVTDVNNDGRADVIAPDETDNAVSVLMGNGDGSFQPAVEYPVGETPIDAAVADLNGDGRPDIVTLNRNGFDVSVLLGNGDGTFKPAIDYSVSDPAGGIPFKLLVADLTGDGRPDILVLHQNSSYVSVLINNGDGTFRSAPDLTAGYLPVAFATGDFNHDGKTDLVVVNLGGQDVSVFLGNGDGTFQPVQTYAVGPGPDAVLVGDLKGDGWDDIVVSNAGSVNGVSTVSVLLNKRDPNAVMPFGMQQTYTYNVGTGPGAGVLVDVNHDHKLDIVVADIVSNAVSVLLNNGDGTFGTAMQFAVEARPSQVVAADFNNDGKVDLAVINADSDGPNVGQNVSILLGNGDGTFKPEFGVAPGNTPVAEAVADVNRDGILDLLVANEDGDDLTVALSRGDGTFIAPTSDQIVTLRNTPYLGDVDGDGVADTVVINGAGEILLRRGIAGTNGGFAPPIVVNPGTPARELTLLKTADGMDIAAADIGSNSVSIYKAAGEGFTQTVLATGLDPSRLLAADLTGDGLDDLIVANALGATINVFFQQADGTFGAPLTLDTGVTPSGLAVTKGIGNNGPNILVIDQSSGDAVVFYNNAAHTFKNSARFRAGNAPSGLQTNATDQPQSRNEPISVVAGQFTSNGLSDLIVVNQGTEQLDTLLGTPGDGFTNPQSALTLSTSLGGMVNDPSGQAVSADFDGDGKLDLAILMKDLDAIWIYKGNGDGTFTFLRSLSAGLAPTGLAVADVNNDGKMDLMVGNAFGDILFILGNGDGTFHPFVNADQRVPLILTKTADGTPEVILANEAQDVATAQVRVAGTNTFTQGDFQQDRSDGLIGPGAILEADLNGDKIPDLIIANSGSNNVLVYLGLAGGGFSATPQSFSVGDNPVGLYVTNLMGPNALPDLVVANEGSNDVSILLGTTDANGNWTFTNGPRLASGGVGPIAVTSMTDSVTGLQDLLVTNGQSGNVAMLPGIGSNGVGTGFFNDANPTVQQIAPGPVQQMTLLPSSESSGGGSSGGGSSGGDLIGVALTQDGSLMRFDLTTGTTTTLFTPTAGNAINAFETMDVQGQNFPVIFTANANDSVSALVSSDGQSYTAKTTVTDAALTGPSALEALQTDSATQFDVYLTDAGDSTPVVLSLDLNAELTPVNTGGNGDENGNGNGNGNGNANGNGNENGNGNANSSGNESGNGIANQGSSSNSTAPPSNNSSADTTGSAGLVITLVTNIQVVAPTAATSTQNTIDPLLFSTSDVVSVTTQASLASGLGDNEPLPSFGQAVVVNLVVSLTDATGGQYTATGVASVTEVGRDTPTLQQFIVGVEDAIDRLVASQATAPGSALTASADAALPAVADAMMQLGDWAGATLREEAGARIPAVADAVVRLGDWAMLTRREAPAAMFAAVAPGLLSDQRMDGTTATELEVPISYVSRDAPLVVNGKLVSAPAPNFSRDVMLVMTAGMALGGVYARARRARKRAKKAALANSRAS